MMRRLTISVDDDIYYGLYAVVGRGNISRFFNELLRPLVCPEVDDKAKKVTKSKAGDLHPK